MEPIVLNRLKEIVADRQSRKRDMNGWQMLGWGVFLALSFFVSGFLWKESYSMPVLLAALFIADVLRIRLSGKPGSEAMRKKRQYEWIWPAAALLALAVLLLQMTLFVIVLPPASTLSLVLFLFAGGAYFAGVAQESLPVRFFALPLIAAPFLSSLAGGAFYLVASAASLAGLGGGGLTLVLRGIRPVAATKG